MIKCIIIDDEPLAIDLIEDHINKTSELKLIGTFQNPFNAIQFLKDNDVNLIFLDVQMPELTGIQFIKVIDNKYDIILTTAYEKYALDAYENDVIDYLLKPISFDRFTKSIQKINPTVSLPQIRSEITEDYIFIKSEYKTIKIFYDDILYLKGMADYVVFQLKDKKILTLDSMKSIDLKMPSSQFIRVHKSYIIPINKIEYIKKNRIVIADEYIPLGATYQERFWEVINK